MGGVLPYIASFLGVMHLVLAGVYHMLILVHKRYPDPNIPGVIPVGAVAAANEDQVIPFERAEFVVVVNPGDDVCDGRMTYVYAIPEGKI